MSSRAYIPNDILKPYVKSIVVAEPAFESTYKVLPDTSVVMGFQIKGRLSYLQATEEHGLHIFGVSGLRSTYRLFKNTDNTSSVLVTFKEGEAHRFFKEPMHELFGESLSMEHFTTRAELVEFEDRLQSAQTNDERVGLVQRFLTMRLNEKRTDTLVRAAIDHINLAEGSIRIADLAHGLHISQSPLEKRFRSIVGATPKKFAAIIRMKNTIKKLDNGNLTTSAYEAGYFDQAHFIKDFKTFTGLTPGEFRKRTE